MCDKVFAGNSAVGNNCAWASARGGWLVKVLPLKRPETCVLPPRSLVHMAHAGGRVGVVPMPSDGSPGRYASVDDGGSALHEVFLLAHLMCKCSLGLNFRWPRCSVTCSEASPRVLPSWCAPAPCSAAPCPRPPLDGSGGRLTFRGEQNPALAPPPPRPTPCSSEFPFPFSPCAARRASRPRL